MDMADHAEPFIEEDFNESMHVEWAKVQAWAARWSEELLIVEEEM